MRVVRNQHGVWPVYGTAEARVEARRLAWRTYRRRVNSEAGERYHGSGCECPRWSCVRAFWLDRFTQDEIDALWGAVSLYLDDLPVEMAA